MPSFVYGIAVAIHVIILISCKNVNNHKFSYNSSALILRIFE